VIWFKKHPYFIHCADGEWVQIEYTGPEEYKHWENDIENILASKNVPNSDFKAGGAFSVLVKIAPKPKPEPKSV